MCTFAVAKVIIALANCHQYAEKERFSFRKRAVAVSSLCVYIGV